MHRVTTALVALAAMLAGCIPGDEDDCNDCVSTGPLVFVANETSSGSAGPVAVGGTETFSVGTANGFYTGTGHPGIDAVDVDATFSGSSASVSESYMLTVHGLAPGSGELMATSVDGDATGEVTIVTAAVDHIVVSGNTSDVLPAGPVAFAANNVQLALSLVPAGGTTAGTQIIDESVVVFGLDGGHQQTWDTWSGMLPAGTQTVMLHTGTSSFAAPFDVADHADSMIIVSQDADRACFAALTGTTPIVGLDFDFVPGNALPNEGNCALFEPGQTTLTATAAGVSATAVSN